MRALHRPVALLALALALAAFAAGCQESGFDERKETARPLKVQHFRGESKVPGQAEAPATLSVDATDNTLALGLKPVLATAPGGKLPSYLRGRGQGVRVTGPVKARDLSAVRAAKPDVIIDDESGGVGLYTRLITIAPTVITAGGGAQWKLNVRLVGEALGRTNDAEALMTDYDRRVAEVRRAVGRGRKVAVVELSGAGGRSGAGSGGIEGGAEAAEGGGSAPIALEDLEPQAVKADSFAGTVLADAGVKPTRRLREADAVLVAQPGASGAGAEPEGVHLPIVGTLRGEDPRIAFVDGAAWSAPGGLLAARAVLDEVSLALSR